MNGDTSHDHRDLWLEINQLRERFAVVESRIAERFKDSPTSADIASLRGDLRVFQERLAQFTLDKTEVATKSDLKIIQEKLFQFTLDKDSVATKSDVDWLKQFFWKAVGAMIAIDLTIITALVAHVFQTKP